MAKKKKKPLKPWDLTRQIVELLAYIATIAAVIHTIFKG